MHYRLERFSALAGVLAVVLWVLGIVVVNATSDKIPHNPSDEQLLTWIQGNTNSILFGGWLFALGCLAFVWFAAILRSHLAAAESGQATFANLAFGGAVMAAVFGVLTMAGDMAAAINKDDISAATAGTLHNGSDMFFVGAELTAILFFLGAAIVALRTGLSRSGGRGSGPDRGRPGDRPDRLGGAHLRPPDLDDRHRVAARASATASGDARLRWRRRETTRRGQGMRLAIGRGARRGGAGGDVRRSARSGLGPEREGDVRRPDPRDGQEGDAQRALPVCVGRGPVGLREADEV